MRKILGALRRADERFGLIAEGDKIVVGLSGGKDSMLLLYALKLYSHFSKKAYRLHGICVDLGFAGFQTEVVESYAKQLDVPLSVIKTDIAEVVFEKRQEKNPCSLCAKMRKGALYAHAAELGAGKAAFAHHMDDALQTLLMSMMYESRMNTLQPKSYLSRRDITLIRPLLLATEQDVIEAVKRNKIPFFKNPCPVDKHTSREQSKEVLQYLESLHEGSVKNMMTALQNTDSYKLWNTQGTNNFK